MPSSIFITYLLKTTKIFIEATCLTKTDDDVLKVLVQSNYWKQFGPIEILVVFSKQVMEMEDGVSRSQHDSMQN